MGKYAKNDAAINQFCKTFKQDHNIEIEPIYTGRMFYGLYDLIKSNYFEKGSLIMTLHTGGIKLPN
jgi:1-aminocyclopropane-1-carboxylate deaminase/D-cysteine desulfhydrase-like pyridoxal-dependent ACC family enzyme